MFSNWKHRQFASHIVASQILVIIGPFTARAAQPPNIPDFARNVLVRVDGKSLPLGEVVRQKAADPQQQTYRELRVANGGTPEGQLELALWCRKQKFTDEEQLHWRMLLCMDPENPQGIKALKLRRYMGCLLTNDDIQELKKKKKESEQSAKEWVPKLKKIKQAIEHGDVAERAAALQELKGIKDPRALDSILEVFSLDDAKFSLEIVEMAADIPGDDAAVFLAHIAMESQDQYIRERVATELQSRPYETYVPVLIARLAAPIELSFDVRLKPGWTNYQRIEWRELTGRLEVGMYNKIRLHSEYTNMDVGMWGLQSTPKSGLIATSGQPDRLQYDYVLSRDSPDPEHPYEYVGRFETPADPGRGKRKGESIEDIQKKVDKANAEQELVNQRIHAALATATGGKVVPDEQKDAPRPQIWWDWWKRQSRRDNYIPKGTDVWTQTGLMPVEQILVGDRVLTRDPKTKELAFHLVMAIDMQSDTQLRSIDVNSRSVLAARDQQFMVADKGWRGVSELEVGMKLDCLAGSQPIEKTGASEGTAKYGLAIANVPTLFVDRTGILTHDATRR
jgi:hypothetical protein